MDQNNLPSTSGTPQPAVKEQFSTCNNIKLLQYTPEIYAGITEEQQIVLYFEQDGVEFPVIGFEGDQGQRKTSLINGLIRLLGGEDATNAINSEKGTKKLALTFLDKNEPNITYEIKETKAATIITKTDNSKSPAEKSKIGSPRDWLRAKMGPIGTNPMLLKDMDGKAQIKWVRSLANITEKQLEFEKDLNTKKEKEFKSRTNINAQVRLLMQDIQDTGYYRFDQENKQWVETGKLQEHRQDIEKNDFDGEELKTKMDAATKKKDDYLKAKNWLPTAKETVPAIEKRIDELEKELELERQRLIDYNDKIKLAEAYLEENKEAENEFNAAQELMLRSGEIKIRKNNIEEAKNKKEKYNTAINEQIRLNKILDEYDLLRKKFIEGFTPKIEGMELVIHDGIDSYTKEEGIYFNNRSISQLSESELWDLFMRFCFYLDIRFLFIENITSLGTQAIHTLNWLVKERGVKVFYTAMVRGENLRFTFLESVK